MKCPNCKIEFPLTFKRYFTAENNTYSCPHCRTLGRFKHYSKTIEMIHAILVVSLLLGFVELTEFLFNKFFVIEIYGYIVGFLFACVAIMVVDKFYQERFCHFTKAPDTIPRKINYIKASLVYLLFLSSVLLTTFFVLTIMDSRQNPQIIADFNKKLTMELVPYEKRIQADLTLLNKNPPFETILKTQDAGVILNDKITWGDDLQPNSKELRKVLKRNWQWWKNMKLLVKLGEESAINKIDTSWMDHLSKYDFWKLEDYPAYRAILERAPTLTGRGKARAFQDLPHPQYTDLSLLVIIHFLKKHENGKGIEGLKIIRKLAELGHSTGTVYGSLFAKNLLGYEAFLVKTFKIKNWTLVPLEVRRAYRRITMISPQIFFSALFQDLPSRYYEYINQANGMCAGALAMITSLVEYQDFLKPKFIFEQDYSELYARNINLQKTILEKCGKEEYAGFLTDTPANANPWFLEEKKEWYEFEEGEKMGTIKTFNKSKMPFWRRNEIHFIPYMVRPQYTKIYSDKKKKKQ